MLKLKNKWNIILHFQDKIVIKIIISDDVEKLPLEAAAKEVYYSTRAKKYY